MITKEQALTENHFEHVSLKNADGSPLRVRRNGKTKTWVTRPNDFRIPVKYGLKQCLYITRENARLFDVPKKETTVVFLVDTKNSPPDHVFAFFPFENYRSYNDLSKVSFSHVGQHSACSVDYAKSCRVASKKESESLKKELEGLGYNLKVVDVWEKL